MKFEVATIGKDMPSGKRDEPVVCPYCGTTVRMEKTSAVFIISKLS